MLPAAVGGARKLVVFDRLCPAEDGNESKDSYTQNGATMPLHVPGPSVKDPELYEKLRDQGNSKEKSARIANAAARSSRSTVVRRGGKSPSYEDWTVSQLRDRAAELGIGGRSKMDKGSLIDALRNH